MARTWCLLLLLIATTVSVSQSRTVPSGAAGQRGLLEAGNTTDLWSAVGDPVLGHDSGERGGAAGALTGPAVKLAVIVCLRRA